MVNLTVSIQYINVTDYGQTDGHRTTTAKSMYSGKNCYIQFYSFAVLNNCSFLLYYTPKRLFWLIRKPIEKD